jgi:AraC-like DNA-binding protein
VLGWLAIVMLLQRPPVRALAPFVERLWHFDDHDDGRSRAARERALPTGKANLVLRLSSEPVRVFAGLDDADGRTFGHAVLSGARASYYLRDTSHPSCSVGVQFRPGGAAALLGVAAGELAGRHAPLEDLWGRSAASARERLLEERRPAARLDLVEGMLLARVPASEPLHPAVVHALARLDARPACSIGELAFETGLSHRHLIALFRRAVGLTPKVYARIRRFQRALERAARERVAGWTEVALACGLYDQSHLTREFQAFAGVPPGAYAPLSADRPNHVPVVEAPAR